VQTGEHKVASNNERLVNFFASKGVNITLNESDWSFHTSSSAQSYGGPRDWGENPVIFVFKCDIKDGITLEEGLKYMYCPALNKGAKIVNVNGTFKVAQLYNYD
jgi:hypothetical protein